MNEHIEQERTKLFEVKKLQLHTGLEGYESKDAYGMFKSTGGVSLGTVGRVFEPTQPTMMFDGFVNALQQVEGANLNTLKFTEMKDGSIVKISCMVGEFSFVNLAGKDDTCEVYMNTQTGFNGSSPNTVYLSTYRLICSNGAKAIATDFKATFKNVLGNKGRTLVMYDDIAKVLRVKDNYLENLKQLSKRKVSKEEIDTFIFKVTGIDPKKENNTRSNNILDAINASVAIEMQDAGATAFAIMNGITRYSQHVVKTNNREDYIYAGQGLKLNTAAQKYALELLN